MSSKGTILILDDSPTFLAIVHKFLRNKDYSVYTANNSKQALTALESEEIDVLILDWEMPDQSGLSVVRMLRSGWKHFDLPVMMLTARGRPEDVIHAMNAGCDDFIAKEDPLEILEVRIQRLLFFMRRLQIQKRPRKERTILVVDDSETFLAATAKFLSECQFRVLTVESGAAALALLPQKAIDLLIIDWMMPEMDGLALIQKIRSSELYSDIPIIMMSGKDAVEDIAMAIEIGADDFINKDSDMRLLEKKIGVLLRIQEQYRCYTQQIIEDKKRVEELVRERTHELEEAYRKLKHTQSQLVQVEKMAALGQMVAGIAHEINNPVAFIKNNLHTLSTKTEALLQLLAMYQNYREQLERQDDFAKVLTFEDEIELEYISEDIRDIVTSSQNGVQRIADLVISLRNFSRLDEGEKKSADLREGIASTLVILGHHLRNRIQLVQKFSDLPTIVCSPGKLNQVFLNILANAIQAIEQKGTITIEGFVEGDDVILKFSDTGCGIPPESLSKVFDPFFTTKEIGQGTGLGLSISYGIIQEHAGEIGVASEIGKGTTFTIRLPIKIRT